MRLSINLAMISTCGSHLLDRYMPSEYLDVQTSAKFISIEGCYFLDVLYHSRGNATKSAFSDATGYECFVNHLHIDRDSVTDAIASSLALAYLIDTKWKASDFMALTLRHIISLDETSSTYRCHVLRVNERWLADDLESYHDPILVIDSNGSQSRE